MSLRGPQWFSVVSFCKCWVSTTINTFMVYACCSCTRVKLAINEQIFFSLFLHFWESNFKLLLFLVFFFLFPSSRPRTQFPFVFSSLSFSFLLLLSILCFWPSFINRSTTRLLERDKVSRHLQPFSLLIRYNSWNSIWRVTRAACGCARRL